MRRRWAAFAIWLLLSAPALAPSIGSPITVVVDAGHGGHDPGAVVEGIEEKDIVLDIALSVFELSRESPIQVVLTRSTDRYVDLKERVRFAERVGAVLYVSIHANYVSDTRVKGIEVYVDNSRSPSDPSWRLAETILEALVRMTGARDRGVRTKKLYMRHTVLPAVLVEVGYLSNPKERSLLLTPSYRELLARAVLEGILEFLGFPCGL